MLRSTVLEFAAGSLWLLGVAGAGAAEGSKLVVAVCNSAHASGKILLPALAEAGTIFAQAGVAIEWFDCHDQPDGPAMMYVRILPGKSGSSKSANAFGTSYLTRTGELNNLADVYWGQVQERGWTSADQSSLLAHVMAHEIGHLLGMKHCNGSIMKAYWTDVDYRALQMGQLGFSRDEAVRLQAAADARVSALSGPTH